MVLLRYRGVPNQHRELIFLFSKVLAGNGLVSRLPKYRRLIQSKLTHFLPSKLCPTLTLLLILKKRITSSTFQKANLRLLLTHYSQPIYSWCNFLHPFHLRSVSISSCFFSILCSCLVNFFMQPVNYRYANVSSD